MLNKQEWGATGLLLFVTFVWGASFVVVQNAIEVIEPFSYNFIRFLVASLWIGLYFLLSSFTSKKTRKEKKSFQLNDPSLWKIGFLLGFFLFLGFLLQTYGLKYTTSSKTGFITGLNVAFTPLLLFIFLKNKPKLHMISGILLSIIGLFMLTMRETEIMNKGDMLVVLCAIAFSVHIILTGKYSNSYNTLSLAFVQLVTVAFLSLINAILFEDVSIFFKSSLWTNSTFLLALFITSFFCTALAYGIQTYAQRILPPTKVAMIFIFEPVFAALTGVLFAGEIIPPLGYVGCLLILIGTIFVEVDWPKKSYKEVIKRG